LKNRLGIFGYKEGVKSNPLVHKNALQISLIFHSTKVSWAFFLDQTIWQHCLRLRLQHMEEELPFAVRRATAL